MVLVGLRPVQGRLQARPSDRAAGADLLGRRGLGDLAGFGEEQLRVDLAAGGIEPPVPIPIGPLDWWQWAGELLLGGGQPLGQRRLPGAGTELPEGKCSVASQVKSEGKAAAQRRRTGIEPA
jgi:hypothetical protein